MSLINDALKRAKEAQQQARPAEATLHFRPVESSPAQTARHSVGLLVPFGLVGVALLGLVLLWEKVQERGARQEMTASKQIVATETIRAKPISMAPTAPVPEPASTATAIPAVTASTPAVPAPMSSSVTVTASVRPRPIVPGETVGTATASVATQAASSAPTTNATSIAESQAPKPLKLKLQSVIFGSSRPSAMINGRPLFIGDRIGDFRVTAIGQDSATLVGAGQTNILSLAE